MGGEVESRPSTSVITYTDEADTWETGPPLPSPQSFCKAVAIQGRVVLYSEQAVFVYENAAWSQLAVERPAVSPSCGAVLLG